MEKKLLRIVFAVLFLLPVCANATIDVNIYSDTTISSGNYGKVNIYDTPPVQTTVNMTGGQIEYCNVYNTANFNFNDGSVLLVTTYNSSNATVDVSTATGFIIYNDSKIYLHSLGNSSSISIFDDAELHVYGYGFVYDPSKIGTNNISGFWGNGQAFTIYLRQPSNYDPYTQVILHVIPEPSAIFTLGLFSLFMRKRGNVLK